jgi:RimJ/RimL family protein N-acetyltransferase
LSGRLRRVKVEPITLEGHKVRLEPLCPQHFAALHEAGQPEIFQYVFRGPEGYSLEAFSRYLAGLISRPDTCAFAIVLRETERAIGVTTYLEIRPEHRGLEIGNTWIAVPYQGTAVNPECKYLLLRHAFETLGALRVQLKTDGRNLHSQKAIAKLGARWEGTMRKHVIMADGYVRDTVMFSIIDDEWPGVKARLEARLGISTED